MEKLAASKSKLKVVQEEGGPEMAPIPSISSKGKNNNYASLENTTISN